MLEHNPNLLNHKCCPVSQNTDNEIHQMSIENKEMKIKKSPDKNENRDSNRNNTNINARTPFSFQENLFLKNTSDGCFWKSVESDQGEVRDNKTNKDNLTKIL